MNQITNTDDQTENNLKKYHQLNALLPSLQEAIKQIQTIDSIFAENTELASAEKSLQHLITDKNTQEAQIFQAHLISGLHALTVFFNNLHTLPPLSKEKQDRLMDIVNNLINNQKIILEIIKP